MRVIKRFEFENKKEWPGFWIKFFAILMTDVGRRVRNEYEEAEAGWDELMVGNGFLYQFEDWRKRVHVRRIDPFCVLIKLPNGGEPIYYYREEGNDGRNVDRRSGQGVGAKD